MRATPQQNGVAERMNCILDEGITSLLSDSHLPARFWGEALSCYQHALNCSPSAAVSGMTPTEAFYHSVEVMVYQYDKLFGYGCWMTSIPTLTHIFIF